MIGLAGGHRVGKSKLAAEFAKKYNWTFEATSVSAIFKELGHDPAEVFDFKTRITIQEQVLIRLNRFFKDVQGQNVITDRTPIDMLAYTMAEAVGDAVLPEDQARFEKYVSDCYACTNRWFSSILVVQPGIALVHEEGKATLNAAYIEHLNSLIIGLCVDGRLKVPHFYIPRHRTDMTERIASVDFAKSRVFDFAMAQGRTEGQIFH